MRCLILIPACCCFGIVLDAQEIFVRTNQLGYSPLGTKIAVAFSKSALLDTFEVITADSRAVAFRGKAAAISDSTWGGFDHHVELDFSGLKAPGHYYVRLGETKSLPFTISPSVYA